jgi:hypothetical protein
VNRRVAGIVVIVLALAGLGVADRGGRTARPAAAARPGLPMPVAYPSSSLRSTWFCAGGTAAEGGAADHTVVIANPAAHVRKATVTVFPAAADGAADAAAIAATPPVVKVVDVPARSRVALRVGDVVAAPFAAALVEVDGGDVAVEHTVGSGAAAAAAPCASDPAPAWYFPAGSTAKGAQELLALFNPFPDNAVVDITMATTDGFRQPQQYEGLVVPGQHLVVLDLGVAIARHDSVSTAVVTRSGRLVVDRVQLFDGTAVPAAAVVGLGAPEPAPAWAFPDGQTADGLSESFVVYNPTDADAEVDVDITLDQPDVNGEVDPVAVSVAPHAAVTVNLNAEQRVPAGVAHATVVRSVNRTPIVAERVVTSVAPAPRSGVTLMLGSPMAAPQWILPVGSATSDVAEFVVLLNPSGDTTARVNFTALARGQDLAIDGLQSIEVRPGGRVTVDLGAHVNRADLPLLLQSTAPVVAERGMYAASNVGFTQGLGVPLPKGAVNLKGA